MQKAQIKKRKINSRWIKSLNIRHEIMKLLEGNLGKTLEETGIWNDFLLDKTPKAQAAKAKFDR